MSFQLVCVVAVADNGVIGHDGQVPWKVSSDMKHFRHITMNKPVIMGRKTWESLAQPLLNRDNIVVTTNPDYKADGGHVMTSLEQARTVAQEFAEMRDVDEIMIIGGANIYQQSLPMSDILHLTEIHGSPEGDTKFPDIDPTVWRETSREKHGASRKDEFDYSFVVYEKIAKSAATD